LVLRNISIALLSMILGLPAFAQSGEPSQSSSPDVPGRTRVRPHHSGPPCWRQAGITPDMVNQRWQIEDQQKLRIAQVCAEPSTSAQQKHDKIEQIHADTDQAIAQLIPSKELAAFNKCQAELDQHRPKPVGQKDLGPCGGVIPNSDSAEATPTPDHRHTNRPTNH